MTHPEPAQWPLAAWSERADLDGQQHLQQLAHGGCLARPVTPGVERGTPGLSPAPEFAGGEQAGLCFDSSTLAIAVTARRSARNLLQPYPPLRSLANGLLACVFYHVDTNLSSLNVNYAILDVGPLKTAVRQSWTSRPIANARSRPLIQDISSTNTVNGNGMRAMSVSENIR